MNFMIPGSMGGGIFFRPAFNPRVVPDLSIWLRAVPSEITADNSTATPTVRTWHNTAGTGSGYDFDQSTKDNQPQYITNALNGHPIIRFDGSNDALLGGASAKSLTNNTAGLTIFVVAKGAQSAAADQNIVYFSTGTSGTAPRAIITKRTTNNFSVQGRTLDADSNGTAGGVAETSAAFHVYTGCFDYTNGDIYAYSDGVETGNSTTTISNGNTSATDSLAAVIGARGSSGSSQFLNGDIAEILVYRRALTSAERLQVRTYLMNKYGL